ncbi:hypothetical protein FPSE_07418 [Fusarium pseudograminearum CS3096]|uniref:Uncharacterized protein n=1 Tax=Fusarium pseudograminearum (strain CS3096) TaxID=1028729 RepID=K3VEU6_FUSPC|nr:hypothetical protein FPSE_07418 [Fusarium pseudograminearum CS3096]EKJ72394.1 hypothetical protein FPSE_07418 [Fusarium pseudograminearum CS3096]
MLEHAPSLRGYFSCGRWDDETYYVVGGWRPLREAMYRLHVDAIKFLLIHGANPNTTEAEVASGQTTTPPLAYAYRRGRESRMNVARAKALCWNDESYYVVGGWRPMREAIYRLYIRLHIRPHIDAVKSLLMHGADPNMTEVLKYPFIQLDDQGLHHLEIAVSYQHLFSLSTEVPLPSTRTQVLQLQNAGNCACDIGETTTLARRPALLCRLTGVEMRHLPTSYAHLYDSSPCASYRCLHIRPISALRTTNMAVGSLRVV